MSIPQPKTWLITLIAGLPLFSETVYTPALPDIAHSLGVSESWVEYTLTIYLFGFAIGTFLFGLLSDRWGRRPCMLLGFFIYVLGCIGCYGSYNIYALLGARFVQALGGSVGSVLGQAICRDSFHGTALGKIYAIVITAMALFPAIGPIFGGAIDQQFGWPAIFLALIFTGIGTWFCVYKYLPETHPTPTYHPVLSTALRMIKDVRVIAFALIVGGVNGITFSYFGEGSFYLIDLLGLSPTQYGLTFLGIALAGMIGGYISKRLLNVQSSEQIMTSGIYVVIMGAALLTCMACMGQTNIFNTLLSMIIIFIGTSMVASNALSLALVEYKSVTGAASALFGLFYYLFISLFTLIMGLIRNGTLYPMPIYFLAIGMSLLIIRKTLLQK